MKLFQNIFLPALLVMSLLTGCASMTPRYEFSDELNDIDEENSALLQIPTNTSLSEFDGIEASFSVHYSINSQAVVQHHYRETLIPQGLHTIIYNHNQSYTYYNKNSQSTVRTSQFIPFATTIPPKIVNIKFLLRVIYWFRGKLSAIEILRKNSNMPPGNFKKVTHIGFHTNVGNSIGPGKP